MPLPQALQTQIDGIISWCETNTADAKDLAVTLEAISQALTQRSFAAHTAARTDTQALIDADRVKRGKVPVSAADVAALAEAVVSKG